LPQVEGLREVVVAARLQAADAVDGVAARGEEKHRRVVAALAQSPTDREPIQLRQHDIQQHEAAGVSRQPLQGPPPVRDGLDLIALRTQVLDDTGPEMRIVLHDEDAVHHECSRRAGTAASPGAPATDWRGSLAGHASTNSAPWPTPSLWAPMRPPVSCISRRTM